jgi:hypothetical protein
MSDDSSFEEQKKIFKTPDAPQNHKNGPEPLKFPDENHEWNLEENEIIELRD